MMRVPMGSGLPAPCCFACRAQKKIRYLLTFSAFAFAKPKILKFQTILKETEMLCKLLKAPQVKP